MKKVLLIGFILAILLFAFPQGVMAADIPKSVTIDATYGNIPTTFTVDNNVQNWALAVGTTPYDTALTFHVTTLDNWQVTAAATDSGKMRGSVGVLQTELAVNTPASGWTNFLTALQNSGTAKSTEQSWSQDLAQTVTTTDFGSTSGYHITITFTCSTTF
jgi:hypothetical protein